MPGIRRNVIDTGYIPVEYNMYMEITEKAEKFDRMMSALRDYNRKHTHYLQTEVPRHSGRYPGEESINE